MKIRLTFLIIIHQVIPVFARLILMQMTRAEMIVNALVNIYVSKPRLDFADLLRRV